MSPSIHELLDRHQRRREQDIPTISVLTGPPGLGVRAWRRWGEILGRSVAISVSPDAEGIRQSWVLEWLRGSDPVEAARKYLAQRLGMDELEAQSQIRAKSRADLELFLSYTSMSESDAAADKLCCRLLMLDDANPRDWLVSGDGLMLFHDHERPWTALLATLHAFSPECAPALVVSLSEDRVAEISLDEVERAAECLSQISSQAPSLPVALTLPENLYLAYLSACKESRAKATCRETVVRIDSFAEEQIAQAVSSSNLPDVELLTESMRRLARDGADDSLIQKYVEAIAETAAVAPGEPETAERARSAAEAFLYDRLESMAETAGVFELNRQMEFSLGHQCMEVDLVSVRDRLAIEIDGYFHFVDCENYRRDRRKDFFLQREGYLVLRFLAEDVVTRLEDILDTILAALALRRTQVE